MWDRLYSWKIRLVCRFSLTWHCPGCPSVGQDKGYLCPACTGVPIMSATWEGRFGHDDWWWVMPSSPWEGTTVKHSVWSCPSEMLGHINWCRMQQQDSLVKPACWIMLHPPCMSYINSQYVSGLNLMLWIWSREHKGTPSPLKREPKLRGQQERLSCMSHHSERCSWWACRRGPSWWLYPGSPCDKVGTAPSSQCFHHLLNTHLFSLAFNTNGWLFFKDGFILLSYGNGFVL